MVRNARPSTFRPPWLPSQAQKLKAFRTEPKRFNARPGDSARGYDQAWRELRAAHLALEPYCRACAKAGRQVREIMVDHRQAPERRLDLSNLQSLGVTHHQSKTQRERRA